MLLGMFEDYQAEPIKWAFNVFSLIDSFNGQWYEGFNGEMICVGGLQHNSAVIGGPHAGKTQLALFLQCRAINRYYNSTAQAMDTENTLNASRIINQSAQIHEGKPFTIMNQYSKGDPDARCEFIDGNKLYYDMWFDMLYKAAPQRDKQRGVKKHTMTYPVPDEGGKEVKRCHPHFCFNDSLTEAKTDTSDNKATKKGIDDSTAKTEFMDDGAIKGRALSKSPRLQILGDIYVMYTASLDEKVDIQMGGPPGAGGPKKKVGYIDPTLHLKKVSNQFLKVTTNIWWVKVPRPLYKGTSAADRVPKYPMDKSDIFEGNTDLEYQQVVIARAKAGPTGISFKLVKSQRHGVQPTLTELEFIKDWGKAEQYKDYGISSGGQYQHVMDLYPDVKWRYTTVRQLKDEDPRLEKAIELTAWLKSLYLAAKNDMALSNYASPKEIYENLKARGYDWNILLDTRSYWLPRELEAENKPYLSALDLIRMNAGLYHPKWYPVKETDLKKGE